MKGKLHKRLLLSMGRISVLLFMALVAIGLLVSRPVNLSSLSNHVPAEKMVHSSALKHHVTLLSQDFSPRDFRHPDNLNKSVQYISSQFKAAGADVLEQPYDCYGVTYKNIIASFGPASDSVIIVGAHYDAVEGMPGADDNASGVAGLLEIGHMLSTVPLNSRVILAAYCLEEPPFYKTEYMGSVVHAKSLKDEGVNVQLMICLEMIGYFTEEPGSQQYPIPFFKLYYPDQGNFIAIVDQMFSSHAGRMKNWMRKEIDLPVYSINGPKWLPGLDWSDHWSFWEQGYPAVMITDTAFYRNTAYHSMTDTADRLNYEKMAQVVYGIFTYVHQLANDSGGDGS
jgi:peptidase M28-like protein